MLHGRYVTQPLLFRALLFRALLFRALLSGALLFRQLRSMHSSCYVECSVVHYMRTHQSAYCFICTDVARELSILRSHDLMLLHVSVSDHVSNPVDVPVTQLICSNFSLIQKRSELWILKSLEIPNLQALQARDA
jgi:hypothetical protein